MPIKTLSLALQGGGAHGAFTWGVIDRLLEEKDIRFEGFTGTSAGAMNAAALACGLIRGGNAGGKIAMDHFWRTLSESVHALNPYQSFQPGVMGWNTDWSPLAVWMNVMTQMLSPYQTNPMGHNPLRKVVKQAVDFELLRSEKKLKLFVSATNVETNRIRVFRNDEISPDVLLASSCLPFVHHAVEIEGVPYWDGGFMGNPILEPLIYHCATDDIMIIQINPMHRAGVPTSSQQILGRLNELTFNSSLMRELRSIVSILKLSKAGDLPQKNPYTRLHLHCAEDANYMTHLGLSSKFNTHWSFLCALKEKGRGAAERWLKVNKKHLGKRTTMDLSGWHMETPESHCLDC